MHLGCEWRIRTKKGWNIACVTSLALFSVFVCWSRSPKHEQHYNPKFTVWSVHFLHSSRVDSESNHFLRESTREWLETSSLVSSRTRAYEFSLCSCLKNRTERGKAPGVWFCETNTISTFKRKMRMNPVLFCWSFRVIFVRVNKARPWDQTLLHGKS